MAGFRRAALAACVAGLTALATGCATIAPYEREVLARPEMQLDDSRGVGELLAHAVEVREGTAGGFGGEGGGCGCN